MKQQDRGQAGKRMERFEFASDNTAGIAPEAWEALQNANESCEASYGEDRWTARACELIRDTFECDCDIFFTFTGTAANSLALAALCNAYHAVICHEHAHLVVAECAAPEFFSGGAKVLTAGGAKGKLDPAQVKRVATHRGDVHFSSPRVISLSQPTELGTVYTVAELDRIRKLADQLNLYLHMDGARFANAVASLQVTPAEISWKRGVDVVSLGGSKLGMPAGEAVVFFNRSLAREFEYRCKQAGQLASKMRYLTAPWVGMLEHGAWLRHAHYANECARKLSRAMNRIPGVKAIYPVQTNAVFVKMPERMEDRLRKRGWRFNTSVGDGCARFMCSWNTRSRDIDDLIADLRALV